MPSCSSSRLRMESLTMPTAEKSFSSFLFENADHILKLALKEGFVFSVKESSRRITVRCMLPNGHIRFVVFDDHRVENSHGNKPHVCNQWHKAVGDPVSFTLGKDITDTSQLENVLRATAIMCLTQSDAYDKMKVQLFL